MSNGEAAASYQNKIKLICKNFCIKMISKDKRAFLDQTFENIISFRMPLVGSKILCNVTDS